MENQFIHINTQRLQAIRQYADHGTGLTRALARYCCYREDAAFVQELAQATGKPLAQLTLAEFLCPALLEAFENLAGAELARKLPRLLALRMEGQYSRSPWRRSYRSRDFGDYAWEILAMLRSLVSQATYTETLRERLYIKPHMLREQPYLLALEIRDGNQEIISLLREAILGDNSQLVLNQEMIQAIVISGQEPLLSDLIRLLLAAQLQEGLRQQILESADVGAPEVLARFLKVCLEENLFRFSSAIRAFDVWCGLGYGDAKPAAIQKFAQTAYDCLTDPQTRQALFQSDSNTETYFALWAQGCYDVADTFPLVTRLLEDPRHYRRVLGWFFVTQTDDPRYRLDHALAHLQEQDEELLAWVVHNLSISHHLYTPGWQPTPMVPGQAIPNPNLPQAKEVRIQVFQQLRELAAFIGGRTRSFTGNPFEFTSVTLDSEPVYQLMLALARYDLDPLLVDQLLERFPSLTVDQRISILRFFLLPQDNHSHRRFLQDCLNDRSIQVKETAVDRLADCTLTGEDLECLSRALRSKSSDFRSRIVGVLKTQDISLLRPQLAQMLQAPNENQLQAAMELILALQAQHPQVLTENLPLLQGLRSRKLSTQSQILLDQLFAKELEAPVYGPENGFGLYDPQVVAAYASSPEAPGAEVPLLSAAQLKQNLVSAAELSQLVENINLVFQRHSNEEIEVARFGGSREKVLFGDPELHLPLSADSGCLHLGDREARLEMVPFWEDFREALGEYGTDVTKMLGLYHVISRSSLPANGHSPGNYTAWYAPIAQLELAPQYYDRLTVKYGRRYWQIQEILEKLPSLFDPRAVFAAALLHYRSMIAIMGPENLDKPYLQTSNNPSYFLPGRLPQPIGLNHRMLTTWRSAMGQLALHAEDFGTWFSLEYRLESRTDQDVLNGLQLEDAFRAFQLGLIPQDLLMEFLMRDNGQTRDNMIALTDPARRIRGRQIYHQYPFSRDLVPRVLDRIVTVEEKRGELRTPVTRHCLAIQRFEGAHHFCSLLAALGRENFFRGYEYAQNDTKQAVLSRLLKRCYPGKEDTPEGLAVLLRSTDISDKRLAEAVMYAPQWAGFAEKILGWPGLKCGVWFFHAHINETFSAEKETETAIFSPISPQQFNDGAFDRHWFFEAYDQLGQERFQILYKAAKYITAGSNQHRRSQLYADAVLGRLDADALMQEIREKRNQEKLRCYPLIPIPEGDTREPLRRYEFLQKFLKESKQFGAQRRDSEKKACATALENLAITMGLMDVNRLMWQMESRKLEEIRPLMEPVVLDGVTLRLTIDHRGDSGIAMEKGGKALKTLPKALSKNETYLQLKATVKELTELKRRSRESLERAMTECTWFGLAELQSIWDNPVLQPLLRDLVWTNGQTCGFLAQTAQGFALTGPDGVCTAAAQLRLAHPHDLKTQGIWPRFMRLLYGKQLVQPFKQVFREYYPITADERQERTISRRYAGHQVQPRRTVALLKGRGWTVDYEEGLQKVFYQENLIVRMFAMADWFSPADIEAPTLETVQFFHRRTGEPVPLEEVPPILFSETMRDLDLVVSVAHVGGVDPEASHSTVEMRAAIATELLALLGIPNVSRIGSHAKIQGSLGNYSVHLGSGVVHAEGVGMVSILPVHSQARGRIFLPFADDDPKTAEILSKILLLSEDQKIKDPSILQQISG